MNSFFYFRLIERSITYVRTKKERNILFYFDISIAALAKHSSNFIEYTSFGLKSALCCSDPVWVYNSVAYA